MRAGWMVAMFMVAGCGGGRGSLLLGITASPPIIGVDEVRIIVVVTNAAKRESQPAVHLLKAPTDFGEKPYRLNLQLPPEVRGNVTVAVTARKAGLDQGSGMAEGTVADGVENELIVRIGDGGMVDMARPADLDMAMPADLDMARPVDLDMAMPPPDLGCPVEDKEWALWPMPNPPGTGLPNTASYDTSVPGIVKDRVTGLEWQRVVDPNKYTWADAKTYCATLVLKGGCWRLPTYVELVSLVDFTVVTLVKTDGGTQSWPVIDSTAFPNTPMDSFWASSPHSGQPSNVWYVRFNNSSSNWLNVGMNMNVSLRVRCVR